MMARIVFGLLLLGAYQAGGAVLYLSLHYGHEKAAAWFLIGGGITVYAGLTFAQFINNNNKK